VISPEASKKEKKQTFFASESATDLPVTNNRKNNFIFLFDNLFNLFYWLGPDET
jgi:hypothetical protein